jgi:hypothetical protein
MFNNNDHRVNKLIALFIRQTVFYVLISFFIAYHVSKREREKRQAEPDSHCLN